MSPSRQDLPHKFSDFKFQFISHAQKIFVRCTIYIDASPVKAHIL
jgi:hypothetical protein